jgi:ribose transport system permease protein
MRVDFRQRNCGEQLLCIRVLRGSEKTGSFLVFHDFTVLHDDHPAGATAGLINGVITTTTRITPFVVTLGTMSVYSGIALIISGGQTVYGVPKSFDAALAGTTVGVPTPILIALSTIALATVMMKWTKLGEYSIAIGGNREVARLAGVNVAGYTTAAYMISGLLAALAGMVTVARLGAADPTLGQDLLLPSIAAAVMGGADLMGGEGSMIGQASARC